MLFFERLLETNVFLFIRTCICYVIILFDGETKTFSKSLVKSFSLNIEMLADKLEIDVTEFVVLRAFESEIACTRKLHWCQVVVE